MNFLATRRIYYFFVLIAKRCGRLLIAQNGPDSCIQKTGQATVRDEIWFMAKSMLFAADGTVAIYFQQFYMTYGQLFVNVREYGNSLYVEMAQKKMATYTFQLQVMS